MSKKRTVCIILACVLAVGAIAIPVQLSNTAISDEDPKQEVSDYFYVQIYDEENNVVSKYKVLLTGTVSLSSWEITAVDFELESGDVCETSYSLYGSMAEVTISHPSQGYWTYVFLLDETGTFTGYSED